MYTTLYGGGHVWFVQLVCLFVCCDNYESILRIVVIISAWYATVLFSSEVFTI